MSTWIVVLVKDFDSAKQRLGPVLGSRREAFARALVAQTLAALAGAQHVSGILVVTADPEVAQEARQQNADVLQDASDLNTACARGLAEACASGADICAIFHADLALLSSRGVDALIGSYLARRRHDADMRSSTANFKKEPGQPGLLPE